MLKPLINDRLKTGNSFTFNKATRKNRSFVTGFGAGRVRERAGMPTRNVNLTDELEREERQYEAKLSALRSAIDEGDATGVAKGDVFARVRKNLNLPAMPR